MFLEHVSEKHPTNDILVSAERCNKLREPHIFNASNKPVENTFDTEEPLQILHYDSGFELIWISTFPRFQFAHGSYRELMYTKCSSYVKQQSTEEQLPIAFIFVRLGSVEKEVEAFSPFVAWCLLDVFWLAMY